MTRIRRELDPAPTHAVDGEAAGLDVTCTPVGDALQLAPLPSVGDVIGGKYRLLKQLGEGGMGLVFEGFHERLNQRVAVKVLRPSLMGDRESVARFEREARAAGQLRGVHAARIIDVDATADGVPFLVMELLEGRDLSSELALRTRLPVGEAVEYVLQACAAMAEAHAVGVVHRDLKPSNLFLCLEGDRPVLKVLDFGISKILSETDARVTSTQVTVGTPLYMSPEQIRSARVVDDRADIWALGVILYELLAGTTPFTGSPTAAVASIVTDTPPRLRDFCPEVPPGVEAVVQRALQKRPDDRFADVVAFAEALYPFAPAMSAGRADVDAVKRNPPVPSTVIPSLAGLRAAATALAEARRADTVVVPRSVPPGSLRTGSSWATSSVATATRARRSMVVLATLSGIAVGGTLIALVAFVPARELRTRVLGASTSEPSAAAIELARPTPEAPLPPQLAPTPASAVAAPLAGPHVATPPAAAPVVSLAAATRDRRPHASTAAKVTAAHPPEAAKPSTSGAVLGNPLHL